jgi:hypothetical protein
MGLCGSQLSPEDQAEKGNDKKLEQALRDQQAADAKINKLLLLGQTTHSEQATASSNTSHPTPSGENRRTRTHPRSMCIRSHGALSFARRRHARPLAASR